MKIEKKAAGPCTVYLTVKAEADEIAADYKKTVNLFVREGVIPGFRKGKVPVEVIKNKFAEEIKREAQQTCFRALYPKAVEEAKLDVVDLTGVSDLLLDPATGFTFTAVVETKPEFDTPKYKKLPIKPGDTKVTDDQVAVELENYRRAYAKYEEGKPEDTVADGDFVQFDYVGSLDGKPLAEVVPDQKAVTQAQGFWTQVEEGRFLPEILEALKGMKAGEAKTGITVKFPKDAAPEPLKGKKCSYDVTLKALRRRVLPDDAAFLEATKAESMDKLRADTREALEKAAVARELEDRRNQAIELLLKKSDFDVPPALVRRQTEVYLTDLARRAQYTGLTAEYFEKNRDKILADAEDHAKKQVRLSYILDRIATEEKIESTETDEQKKQQDRAEKALDRVLAEAK